MVGDVPQFFHPGQLYGSIVLVALLLYWSVVAEQRRQQQHGGLGRDLAGSERALAGDSLQLADFRRQ
ncbi:MAG: hypothetical protein R2851_23865 [Caldilineaceae bacterium]